MVWHPVAFNCQLQIAFTEAAWSGAVPTGAGFCGLVQISEEECMAAGVSRWTSGSGNAAYGNSPRLGNTPGAMQVLRLVWCRMQAVQLHWACPVFLQVSMHSATLPQCPGPTTAGAAAWAMCRRAACSPGRCSMRTCRGTGGLRSTTATLQQRQLSGARRGPRGRMRMGHSRRPQTASCSASAASWRVGRMQPGEQPSQRRRSRRASAAWSCTMQGQRRPC